MGFDLPRGASDHEVRGLQSVEGTPVPESQIARPVAAPLDTAHPTSSRRWRAHPQRYRPRRYSHPHVGAEVEEALASLRRRVEEESMPIEAGRPRAAVVNPEAWGDVAHVDPPSELPRADTAFGFISL